MITGIRLQNFRSYNDQVFEFDPGVNIVVGPNASGKTNLLEALYVCAMGKSFRARDLDLIKHGQPWARIDVDTVSGESRIIKIRSDSLPKKQFSIGDKNKIRLATEDLIPTVLFAPDHLQLLTGSPKRRRDHLDQLITQLEPEARRTMSRYQRVLLQRNNILKHPDPDLDNLFVWSIKLGELGGKIADWRIKLIDSLNQQASAVYSELVGQKQTVKFGYVSDLSTDANKYPHLLNMRLQHPKDLHAGFTLAGPHRDDFVIKLNNHNSSSTASRGETRTLVVLIKIIEAKLIEQKTGKKPLILLDDIFSELDSARRQHLAIVLSDYQTIITTTDADSVLEHFLDSGKRIISM